MRIGYFTSIDGWGGSESYLLTLMTGMRARGHEVVLIGIEGSRLFTEVSRLGWECHAWRQSDIPKNGVSGNFRAHLKSSLNRRIKNTMISFIPDGIKLCMGNFREALHLTDLIKVIKPDVMHISVNGYEAAVFAAKWAGIPTLAMCMITPPDDAVGLRQWMMRATVRNSDRVAAQTQACMDSWIKLAGLKVERCSYIWNGIDLRRFNVPITDCKHSGVGPFRLICAARLHPMKGINYLIDAMREVRDLDIVLNICGTGDEFESLMLQARQRGVSDRIHFLGQVERLEEQLALSDAFVLVSVSHESGPAVLSEAMAAGLPLITSDFGPLGEINRHEETGLVVPMHDAASLAQAIRRLALDRKMCEQMGKAARLRAERYCSVDRMCDETHRIYELVLGEKGADNTRKNNEKLRR